MTDLKTRLRRAWQGRISGCQLGKPVELLSMRKGHAVLSEYLASVNAVPLRDYIPFRDAPHMLKEGSRGMQRAEPDDDINYSVLALMMLERHGLKLSTEDVARFWLLNLPAGQTFTAERAAYATLLGRGAENFAQGAAPGFDIAECSDNKYNTWIGAQIRADVYGWVLPGKIALAAELARRDAALSHRDDGVHGAVFVAALGAALPERTADEALALASKEVPSDSEARAAIILGRELAGDAEGGAKIRAHYDGMSPVHTLNNLAMVVWALYSHLDDFSAAIGEAVAAGLDTDCNGATVGGLWGLQDKDIPDAWTAPWRGRVGVSLSGLSEIALTELVDRSVTLAEKLAQGAG